MSVKNITVDHDNQGRRIDNFLFSRFKNIPKSKIYRVIRKGEVRVNRTESVIENVVVLGRNGTSGRV